ncbi:MAG: tRNA (N(6)-L-threonylcarbamoyladenosine(37)-C(2))-methylthiotransferase MtaB [Bdellovibrionales bacterium]|nr:tRNA (N(6)-L-threonylcarbamoyladenosine(37)-C(2))-methylthiotransferase MtaB [Bdellovibrionales bacterium]
MKDFKLQTYGCKVNSYDSGLLQKRLAQAGYIQNDSSDSLHILNTCAVTAEATKEALRSIRKIKAKNPLATVVVTGCAAQVDTDKFESLKAADLVVANSHKGQLEDILKKHFRGELEQRVFKSNIFKKADLEAGGGLENSHTRSFLKIQDGCNSFCTYCVIPFARGKSRSIPIDDLVQRVNELYFQGFREVVLTGVHIGDYEDAAFAPEKTRGLEDLVEQLLMRTKIQRFRLSSLEPVELTPRLVELYKSEPRLCRHFHMSIQSANSNVLKDMKRQYTQKEVIESLKTIESELPGSYVGMDIIVGFPGETTEEFEDTYNCLSSLDWARIHVFPYSPRPGVYANRLSGQWPRSEIMNRAKKLRELSAQRAQQKAISQINDIKVAMPLKNNKSSDHQQLLTRDYWNVFVATDKDLDPLKEYKVKVTGYDQSHESRMDGALFAELI